MIIALDIETIPNPDAVARMPEPEVKTGNIKDPAKIKAKQDEAKAEMLEKAALDPLTGRVACYAFVSGDGEWGDIISEATDAAETALLQGLFEKLGADGVRLVTWNGIGFDLPYIYQRAVLLNVCPANFGAPPLNAWTRRYNTDLHYDLMQVWGNWVERIKLDTVANMVLGERKTEIDVTTFAALIQTEEGRARIAEYCIKDTRLTWRLFERMQGVLFA